MKDAMLFASITAATIVFAAVDLGWTGLATSALASIFSAAAVNNLITSPPDA